MARLPLNEKQIYRLNSRAQMWPSGLTLTMTLTYIFQVIYGIYYISAKNGLIATKSKHINWTPGLKGDQWVWLWPRDLVLWPHTWPWPWIFMVKYWNSCISEWEGRLTLHKGGGSRSFMTMTMTIWWPRSGVWIYQIVTGVTSVVGAPAYLVLVSKWLHSNSLATLNSIYWKPMSGYLKDIATF